MSEKQFSALRVTLTGAAFFIGGAVFALEEWDGGVLMMILGGILLIKDAVLWAITKCLKENIEESEEEKDDNNESN